MSSGFFEDAEEWERHHHDTVFGRYGGTTGAAFSAQMDLLSPVGFVDVIHRPTRFNLAKSLYTPAVAMGGYSLASFMTGEKIYFAERIMHSADMAKRTAVSAGRMAARTAKVAINPYTLMAGAFAYAMYWGKDKNPLLMLGLPSGL